MILGVKISVEIRNVNINANPNDVEHVEVSHVNLCWIMFLDADIAHCLALYFFIHDYQTDRLSILKNFKHVFKDLTFVNVLESEKSFSEVVKIHFRQNFIIL